MSKEKTKTLDDLIKEKVESATAELQEQVEVLKKQVKELETDIEEKDSEIDDLEWDKQQLEEDDSDSEDLKVAKDALKAIDELIFQVKLAPNKTDSQKLSDYDKTLTDLQDLIYKARCEIRSQHD